VDIRAPVGTLVTAYEKGKVWYAGWNENGYGFEVILSHLGANGAVYYSQYGHLLETLYVQTGGLVARGQTLGHVGMTGNASGLPLSESHLHFELRTRPRPGKGTGGHFDPAPSLCAGTTP
jgi:murein DD-endopeptidase MepM/ murein hydrolase activator NlpD